MPEIVFDVGTWTVALPLSYIPGGMEGFEPSTYGLN